jgi:hypothetical protein
MENSSDFAAVHAYLCADGYVIRNPETQKQKYYYIGLRNTNKTLLLDFQEKFEKVFDVKPYLNKDVDRCSVGSKSIYFNIVNNYGSFHSREWNVLKDMNKEQAALWLRAFFDCEGWVSAQRAKNRCISAESVNHDGLQQIAEVLKNLFNINTTIRERSKRDTAAISIYGKDQLIKFEKEVGFLHGAKKKKLRDAINTFVEYTWHFPKDEEKLVKYIQELMLSKATAKNATTLRVNSIKKENLKILSENLQTLFDIKSSVYGPWKNGYGTEYNEMYIYGTEIENVIRNGLLAEEQQNRLKTFITKKRGEKHEENKS